MMQSRPAPDLRLIPPATREAVGRIALQAKEQGISLYFAGGVVRDLLLRRPIKDVDLVVDGDAIELARALAKIHGGKVTAHAKFGTATWSLPPELRSGQNAHDSLDLARARTERYDHPGALPTVAFSTIEEDLRRRDFTINAMALRLADGEVGELLDPFGGLADLEQGLVRVLHTHSFVDDPTRMFRAIRYARRYGFDVAPATLRLVNEDALAVLSLLSGERVRHEFDMIFDEANATAMMGDAGELRLLGSVDARLPRFDPALDTLLDAMPDPTLGLMVDRRTLGYLLWLMELPVEDVVALRERLAFDGTLGKALLGAAGLLASLPALEGARPSEWTERLDSVPPAAIYALWLRTREPAFQTYLETWRHLYPRTTGDDLKQRGLQPGPQFKKILWRLRAAWLDREVQNEAEEQALLERLLKG